MLNIFRSTQSSSDLEEHEMTNAAGEADEEGDSSNGAQLYATGGIANLQFLRTFLYQTYTNIVNIFPLLKDFIPMPTNQPPPNYRLKPINPYRRVPYPSRNNRGDTGLVCQSKNCKKRATHSTVYSASRHPHLTGVKCPIDDGFYRTYNTKHFVAQLREINRRILDTADNNHLDNMELHRMLNSPPTPPGNQLLNGPPTPPATQATRNEIDHQPAERNPRECSGVYGQIAGGHSSRANALCPVNACKACCLKLNTNGRKPCRKHNSMLVRTQKEIRENGRVSIVSSQPIQNVVNPSVGDSSEDSAGPPVTQAGRSNGVAKYKGRLQADFLNEYRALTLKREADERRRAATLDQASRTIALVVWTGSPDDPLGSWGGVVHAQSWPQFALEESKQMKDLTVEILGPDWNGNLQVWNEEHQLWLHTTMDITVTYPINTRKLLVVFPGIRPSSCHEVDRHLASVSTGGKKDAMTLTAFIQRNNSRNNSATPPQRTKGNTNIFDVESYSTPSPQPITPMAADKGKVTVCSIDPRSTCTINERRSTPEASTSRVHTQKKRARSPSIVSSDIEVLVPDPTTPSRKREKQSWSESVTMRDMKRLHDLTREGPNKMQVVHAFAKVFGRQFKFTSSIAHYCRWCDAITPERLGEFVSRNKEMIVAEARQHHFLTEWRSTDATRFEKVMPSKRVKL
ncbi:hypothetical protein DFH28DRAFT_1133028 [Melampsora americana]|nr:hypothetical protein DFH28DRAFT_1133022 [Melampsora americana]KAH9809659.1 hypothetical protein DFH28DRAFT_1133025 [Melampsora americana]KAH9809660.1 hypothetical protein DFH28DRAFT_1133028 [Melampsora americana]